MACPCLAKLKLIRASASAETPGSRSLRLAKRAPAQRASTMSRALSPTASPKSPAPPAALPFKSTSAQFFAECGWFLDIMPLGTSYVEQRAAATVLPHFLFGGSGRSVHWLLRIRSSVEWGAQSAG